MWVDHEEVKFVLMSTGLTSAFAQNDIFIEATLRQIIGKVIPNHHSYRPTRLIRS